MKLKDELSALTSIIKTLDKKVLIIFLSVGILQTVSWYYTSGQFYQNNLTEIAAGRTDSDLSNYLYWFAGDFILLFIIPAAAIKVIFRQKVADYGFRAGDSALGLKITAISIVPMLITVWFISSMPSFSEAYPLLSASKESWNIFILFEAALLLYLIAWEFLWRGYMLFGLEPAMGYYTVLIQMLPFVILHNGKPALETFGAIPGAIILGFLALRTRSFLYGVLIHFTLLFGIDLISILRYRTGDYGTGLHSLLNLLGNL